MQKFFSELYQLLEDTVSKSKTDYLSLSGGLDSSILAYFLKNKKTKGVSVIPKDFVATDLTYCQLIAKKFDIKLDLLTVNTKDLLTGIEETIKILKNFNNIEIRNSVVMYLALQSIKEKGFNSIMTGDGADELFAGYNFFLKMKESELDQELKRIWEVMHFPTKKIAHDLKIKVESPFLNEKMIDLAKSIPVNLKVREEGNTMYGKWILRKIFEEKIPKTIVWRKKSPMQDGAGTTGLINLFESVILDEDYKNRIKQIQKSDNVIIQTKESLHYYDIYKKYFEPPYKLHSSTTKCPKCQFQVKPNAKFCRMCGSYPI